MISIFKMKTWVYNLIGLEDSCICDHCLTESFCKLRLLKTHFLWDWHKYAKKWQTAVFGLTYNADKWTLGLKIKLLWKPEVQL